MRLQRYALFLFYQIFIPFFSFFFKKNFLPTLNGECFSFNIIWKMNLFLLSKKFDFAPHLLCMKFNNQTHTIPPSQALLSLDPVPRTREMLRGYKHAKNMSDEICWTRFYSSTPQKRTVPMKNRITIDEIFEWSNRIFSILTRNNNLMSGNTYLMSVNSYLMLQNN